MKVKQTHSKEECSKLLLPVNDALYVINGKWKLPIIIALSFGNKRFKELQRQVKGITAKMLSKELKELEMNKLVSRTVYDTTPVIIEYKMTEYAQSLNNVVAELKNWGEKHRKKIIGK